MRCARMAESVEGSTPTRRRRGRATRSSLRAGARQGGRRGWVTGRWAGERCGKPQRSPGVHGQRGSHWDHTRTHTPVDALLPGKTEQPLFSSVRRSHASSCHTHTLAPVDAQLPGKQAVLVVFRLVALQPPAAPHLHLGSARGGRGRASEGAERPAQPPAPAGVRWWRARARGRWRPALRQRPAAWRSAGIHGRAADQRSSRPWKPAPTSISYILRLRGAGRGRAGAAAAAAATSSCCTASVRPRDCVQGAGAPAAGGPGVQAWLQHRARSRPTDQRPGGGVGGGGAAPWCDAMERWPAHHLGPGPDGRWAGRRGPGRGGKSNPAAPACSPASWRRWLRCARRAHAPSRSWPGAAWCWAAGRLPGGAWAAVGGGRGCLAASAGVHAIPAATMARSGDVGGAATRQSPCILHGRRRSRRGAPPPPRRRAHSDGSLHAARHLPIRLLHSAICSGSNHGRSRRVRPHAALFSTLAQGRAPSASKACRSIHRMPAQRAAPLRRRCRRRCRHRPPACLSHLPHAPALLALPPCATTAAAAGAATAS